MIERNIKETIREYDEQGNLVREIVTETVEKDSDPSHTYVPQFYYYGDTPYSPAIPTTPTCSHECHCKEGTK